MVEYLADTVKLMVSGQKVDYDEETTIDFAAFTDEEDSEEEEQHEDEEMDEDWTNKAIHHRFRTIPNRHYIPHFRKYLEHHGTKRQKAQNLDELLYTKLIDA
ncbi:unnamed protein product [Didymodactylos carnosus]|uniref:Uncharacterized protein n=1 Tax=Didymodactylos carnosus TaxID=1234261 RepID=A0A815B102_9BILA|nr:unnamed protein product [Didymodactylos carnosus]CAF4048254.1 unnamed protein product [Didymodactylos carnosus]